MIINFNHLKVVDRRVDRLMSADAATANIHESLPSPAKPGNSDQICKGVKKSI